MAQYFRRVEGVKIFANFRPYHNACSWYRIEQPLKHIYVQRLSDVCVNIALSEDIISNLFSRKEKFLVWSYFGYGDDIPYMRRLFERVSGRVFGNPQLWRKHAMIVYDVDEDVFNDDFKKIGELDRVKRNSFLRWHLECLKEASVVLCATNELAVEINRRVPKVLTYVLPNCIDFTEYCCIDHAKSETVKLLWYGGETHRACLQNSVSTFRAIHDKFKQTEWIIWGACFPELWEGFRRITFVESVDFSRFYLRLNSFGHDVALAPLLRSKFNASRGASKFIESAACSKSVACVASRYGAFATDIESGVTGLLYDDESEHFEALSRVVIDSEFRRTIAMAARDWCLENRNPKKHAEAVLLNLLELMDQL